MPYNEETAQRIRTSLLGKGYSFTEKKMFSGICFLVDDKMLCATHTDKKTGDDVLMCRVGDAVYETALEKDFVTPMEFTGKPMRGYIYVTGPGFGDAKNLNYWLQLCLDFNPLAKASKK